MTRSAEGTLHRAPGESMRFDEAAAEQMIRFVEDFGHVYRERNKALKDLTRAHNETLLQLCTAAEARDDDTCVHIVRIGFLAEALALLLGCKQDFARMLRR
ncbi:MAG: phosphohydrolase, partial [Comamonas sp.]